MEFDDCYFKPEGEYFEKENESLLKRMKVLCPRHLKFLTEMNKAFAKLEADAQEMPGSAEIWQRIANTSQKLLDQDYALKNYSRTVTDERKQVAEKYIEVSKLCIKNHLGSLDQLIEYFGNTESGLKDEPRSEIPFSYTITEPNNERHILISDRLTCLMIETITKYKELLSEYSKGS